MKWALSNVNRDDYMYEEDNPDSENKNHTYYAHERASTLFRNTKPF